MSTPCIRFGSSWRDSSSESDGCTNAKSITNRFTPSESTDPSPCASPISLSLSSRGSGRVCYFRCLRRRRDGTTSTTASSGLDAPMRYLEVDVELTKARETRVGMVHAWPSGARSDPRPDYCSSRCSQISLSAKKSRGNQGDAVQSARHTLVRVKPGRWRRVHRPGGRGRDPFGMRTGWTRAVRRPRPPGGSYRVRQTRPHPS